MAAKALTSYHSSVFGNQRVAEGVVTAMNNGDTITFPAMKKILSFDLTPTTNASFGVTFSGNVATLVSGGAITAQVCAVGV